LLIRKNQCLENHTKDHKEEYWTVTRIAIQALSTPAPAAHILCPDTFLKQVLHHLTATIQAVVGVQEAEGFITLVSQKIGEDLNQHYQQAAQTDKLSKAQVIEALLDFKQKVGGQFFLISDQDNTIILGNTCCPFGQRIHHLPALCMMTSNLFGVITAENLGYANVVIEQSIANLQPQCRIVIRLSPDDMIDGREYFATE
jgi:predicted ArsR family transcriptional regulator